MSLTVFRLGSDQDCGHRVCGGCDPVYCSGIPRYHHRASLGFIGSAHGGSHVTAVQQGTNRAYTAKSNAAGVFSVEYVNPGQYKLTVEAAGFSVQVYPNVTLEAGQKLNLNVALKVGSIA